MPITYIETVQSLIEQVTRAEQAEAALRQAQQRIAHLEKELSECQQKLPKPSPATE